jgi:hypothetical protein
MKIGDMLKIKGETTFIKEFEREDVIIDDRLGTRWIPRDSIEQMIQSGEATLIPKKESK